MTRYAAIYRHFFRSSLVRELEFRGNFIARVLLGFTWFSFTLLTIFIIYGHADTIAGWTRFDALTLVGTCFMIQALHGALFGSLMEVPDHVRKGTLDLIVTRPIDSQFWVSMRRFTFDRTFSALAGLLLVIYGASHAHTSLLQILCYPYLVVCALLLFYSFNLLMMTLGIYFVKVDNLWVLGEVSMEVARYPVSVFGPAVQRVFIFILPVAMLGSVPAMTLTQGVSVVHLVAETAWTALALIVTRAFWAIALRSYRSASS